MKVVLIVGNITKSGGTEKAIANITHLLKEYFDITIYSLSSEDNVPVFFTIDKNIPIRNFNLSDIPVDAIGKLKWFSKYVRTIKPRIKDDNPDFIIGFGHNISSFLPLIRVNKSIKIFAAEHIDYDTIPKVSKVLVNSFYKKLDGIIALSSHAKQKLNHLNSNIQVIPNSIAIKKNYEEENKANRIIMVGRLSPEKAYERIVPIAHFLKDKYSDWQIDIFGDGPEKEKLTSLFDKEKLNNITLHGAVKDINVEFDKSKIFIMTSYTEAMPMVILEAKSHGLPVIAYENEGTQLLINNKNDGFLIKNDNVNEFIEKLSLMLENQNDLRGFFGENAIENIAEYSEKEVVKKWLNLLQN